jgi:hypothetical protein
LRELYDYWLSRAGDRPVMRRADLDPAEIPRLLRHLILSDVADGGQSIRYRVVGTDIVTAHGFDYTGMTADDLTTGSTRDFTRQIYGLVVTRSAPVYSEGRFRWDGKEYRWTHRLHLPLSRDGVTVDMVLAGQVFAPERAGAVELLVAAEPEELAADRATPGRQL